MGDNTHISYSEELAEKVCEYIALGYSVQKVSKQEGMPAPSTIFSWLSKHESFVEKYARARKERTNARFERIDQVVQDLRDGTIDHKVARVELDAIKWQLGKEAPAKYGDRMIHAGDPEAPLNPDGLKQSDREAMARFLQNHPDRAKAMVEPTEESNEHDDLC